MTDMEVKSSGEIRADAWRALGTNGQYLRYVAAYLLLMMVMIVISIPLMMVLGAGVGASGIAPFFAPGGRPEFGLFLDPAVMVPLSVSVLVFSVLIIYPLGFAAWGQAAMSIAAMRRGLTVGHALSGWGHGWKMGWIEMVKITYLHLWTLLLVVPGIVKFCSYAMAEYVAVDHPDWNANQCITESRRLMDGHKLRYFLVLLSFIGWFLLVIAVSLLPLVGNLAQWFFMPYFETAKAAFYEDLLDQKG
jgi:hypothetical protein